MPAAWRGPPFPVSHRRGSAHGWRTPEERAAVTFAEWWAAGAGGWAEDIAGAAGFAEAVPGRGLDGLIATRSMRLPLGVTLSQIYHELFKKDRRNPTRSDGHDIWHAIGAATTDLILTFDDRFADHIDGIPNGVAGFKVVRSVSRLLELAEPPATR